MFELRIQVTPSERSNASLCSSKAWSSLEITPANEYNLTVQQSFCLSNSQITSSNAVRDKHARLALCYLPDAE